MICAKCSDVFVYFIVLNLSNVPAILTLCLDVSTLDKYHHGTKLECYGNCKYDLSGRYSLTLCLKECLVFSFCSAVNYNHANLECQIIHIQGPLQSDMVVNSTDSTNWIAVNATDIPGDLAKKCANHNCLTNEKCVETSSGQTACISHGIVLTPGMYGDYLSNTRQYHHQGNTDVSIYECIALTDAQAVEAIPLAMIDNGVYTQATVSCSAADCLDPAVSYQGYVVVTMTGRTCQRWDSDTPHITNYLRGQSSLVNWCRLPDPEPRPWCYTTDPNKRWEFCPIQDCP